jgi:transposase InsO family protein
MKITMQNVDRLTLAEMEEFVEGRRVEFTAQEREAIYGLIERVLRAQRYSQLSKGQRGIVRRFLCKITGLSRAQVTRLITQWMTNRQVRGKPPARRPQFATRYNGQDVALLAALDAAHEDLSGAAVKRILERECEVFGHQQYERLKGISVSHIYNLRRSASYRKHRIWVHKTQSRETSIGERRKPEPKGKPGYLRVDTVHQGHQDGKPGWYHINAVDTVTQWQVVGCVETIAERHLIPVLEATLQQFPFRIRSFHSDNGSEFVNHTVAGLLNKLLVEFTKSRAYRTTDNAMVESKNGAVVRKHIGHGPIESEHAAAFQKFYTAHFNPYLNFHRPCGFAKVETSEGGKRKRIYPAEDYRTPYEKLTSLPAWREYLKPNITPEWLEVRSTRMSDTEAAQRMQKAKQSLLVKSRR